MTFLLTLALVAAVSTVGLAGIVALPWSEAELEGSVQAYQALGEELLQVGSGWSPVMEGALEGARVTA